MTNVYQDPAGYWESRLGKHFDLTDAGYGLLGDHYNAEMYRVRLQALERALCACERAVQGSRVLEIGCGTGFYTAYCKRAGATAYTGLDITEISVRRLGQQYPEYRFIRADASGDGLPVETGAWDMVLAADVLFHITDDAAFAQAIGNLAAALRPGGLMIVSDVFPPATVQTAPHVRTRSLGDYAALFARHAISVQHVEPIFAILQPPTEVPGTGKGWRWYVRIWRYGWRVARLKPVDAWLPGTLAWLDSHLFLPRCGNGAPNSKWLVATKNDAP